MQERDFERFLIALRVGDQEAGAELVRRYEPFLRRLIRMRLTDKRLRRVFDSMDICQSVLAKLFHEVALKDIRVNTEGHLCNLLARMVTNNVIDKVRREQRNAGGIPVNWEPAATTPSPSEVVAQQDLVHTIQSRLSEKERWLAAQRALGRSWVEIAQETGETTDALRMMCARAMARVRNQFPAEEVQGGC
jgi:RNA polymerase sigma-70 factor (ECF subfamily)